MFLRLLVLLLVVTTASALFGHMKNVTVKGVLVCGPRSYAHGKVQLWEDDTLNRDDLLNTTDSDNRGHFRVYGQTREIRHIEPYLLITHNCDNGGLNTRCNIVDRYNVPKDSVGKTYDFPQINLDIATKKRSKKC